MIITGTMLLGSMGAVPTNAASSIAAFPGAEGGGMYATGGRGGKVVHVTNLNDSGEGSFRDAVSSSNRIVVFDVGGTITLKSDVVVKGNITIAGQTAPGGAGITLSGYKLGMGGDNIIVRYVSSRPGERGSGEYDAWGGSKGSNSIVDHCSIGWANDEQWGLYSNNVNQTVQYSIIGPSNCVSTHAKGAHGFGIMFGKGESSWHHNMIASNISRNFRGKVEKTSGMDFVNNVIFNWGYQTAYGTHGRINYVGNYLKAGQSTRGGYRFINISSGTAPENYRFYLTGNKIVKSDGTDYSTDINQNNWNGGINYGSAGLDESDYKVTEPIPVLDVNGNNASVMNGDVQTADEAFETVLAYAGAGISANSRPKIDQEVMEEARTGNGYLTGGRDFSLADSDQKKAIETYDIKQVDYEPYYPSAVSKQITDTDNDGMPDDWELARGLNPNKDDSSGDYLGKGYMNIEYYINDLTVNSFPDGVVEESPTSVDLGEDYTNIKEDLEALKLDTSSIKQPSDLVLPQNGSKHGLSIAWTSSSSAIKIKNNQIYQVNRKSEEQNVTLTASISAGDYNMNKTFSVKVLSDVSFWKASEADGEKKAGTELFDGLTMLFDATYKASSVVVDDESFDGYISSSESGSFADGKATGTAFKYQAEKSGFLTVYITRLGSETNAKTLYITEEGAKSKDNSIASVSGNADNTSLTTHVDSGKTYYIYVSGSKGCFMGIEFSLSAKPVWWRASGNADAGSELMKNLTPSEELTYKESVKDIDGEAFGGAVSGSTNPSDNGAKGAALKYTPDKNGIFTVYCKVGIGKTAKINDADGNVVCAYTNESEESEFASLSGEVKAGTVYYAYVVSSKADFYGASFTEVYGMEEATTAEPTNEPQTPTIEPTSEPQSTSLPDWSINEIINIRISDTISNALSPNGVISGIDISKSDNENVRLYGALYSSDGVLLELYASDVFNEQGIYTVDTNWTLPENVLNCVFKVFMLDGLDTMKPYSNQLIIK
jgi:hypothetical protein